MRPADLDRIVAEAERSNGPRVVRPEEHDWPRDMASAGTVFDRLNPRRKQIPWDCSATFLSLRAFYSAAKPGQSPMGGNTTLLNFYLWQDKPERAAKGPQARGYCPSSSA